MSNIDLIEAHAGLLAAMAAIREAQADHTRRGCRTGAADVAEIRAGRFLAQHGDTVLLALSAAQQRRAA